MDISYGAVVVRRIGGVEYLLVRHTGPGHWDFPKGHPDPGESPGQTAAREVLEETNCIIRQISGFSEKIEYILPRGEPKEVTFFLAEYLGEGEHTVDPAEIAEVAWFSGDEALGRITFENSKRVLRKAMAFSC